jgi:hypothetical protein
MGVNRAHGAFCLQNTELKQTTDMNKKYYKVLFLLIIIGVCCGTGIAFVNAISGNDSYSTYSYPIDSTVVDNYTIDEYSYSYDQEYDVDEYNYKSSQIYFHIPTTGEMFAEELFAILPAVPDSETRINRARKVLVDAVIEGRIKPVISIDQLAMVVMAESSGDDFENAKPEAFGSFQITAGHLIDVCGEYGIDIKTKDLLGDRHLSALVTLAYMNMYGTESRFGQDPTFEHYLRLHRKGPRGWKTQTAANYAKRVMSLAEPSEGWKQFFWNVKTRTDYGSGQLASNQ